MVAAADHTPAAAWETSLQRTSGKVELPLAASDAPMGGPKTSPTVFGCLRGSNMRPVVQVQLGEACRRLSACMAASLGIRDRHANARSTPLALWCVPGPNMRVVVPVQIGEACRRLSAGMAAALGIRVPVAFRWSFPCSSAAEPRTLLRVSIKNQ